MPNAAPALSGFGPTLAVNENDTPQLLDADVTFADPDGNFDGGSLTLSGLRAEDRTAIRNQGTGAGQIGVSGADVSYGGIVIGTFSGGVGGTLTVTFNAAATSAAIEALIENLTYANASDAPIAERTLVLNVTDADGADLGPSATTAGFTELVGALNPFDGIDVGGWAAPDFVDLDGDGDLDAVVGEAFGGTLSSFENIGDDADADSFDDFVRLTGTANPLNGMNQGPEPVPAFVDLDRDGDMDAVVGLGFGTIALYENIGDDADAGFIVSFIGVAGANTFGGVDMGFGATPSFADLDADGDMDAVIGNADGILRAFENVDDSADSDSLDDFVELTGVSNPFNGIDVGFKSAPAFVDLDGDGDLDAVVGEYFGTFRAFENVGDGGDPDTFAEFVERTGPNNPFAGVDVGFIPRASFVDLDGDGRMEAVIGEHGGTLRAFGNVPGRGAAIHVEVTAANDAPTLAGFASSLTVPGDATPLLIDGDVAFADPDVSFGSGTLSVSGLLAEDRVAIRDEGIAAGQIGVTGANLTYGGTLIGTFAGGAGTTLTVTFNDAATSAAVDALIEHLTYANASATPTPSRTLTLNVTDAAGAALTGGAQSITINAPSGAAPVAQDDAVSTDEATPLAGSVFANNGSGVDSDADGPAPAVATVNGSAANVGTQIVLASGALLTLNADGTFSYDPNGAFDETPTAGSGASNQPAIDSFTYTLAGGGSATVTVTINGVDSNDLLIGTAGDDTFIGGIGDDTYIVDNAGDSVIENADEGTDEIRTGLATYSIAPLANVENLRGTSAAGQLLTGNAGGNVITGDAGDDTVFGLDGNDQIQGGGGADSLAGGLGDDTLRAGSGGDWLFGEDGADTLLGEDGADRLEGGAGRDYLLGGTGTDYFDGGADADWLFGEDGNDTMLGGEGDDRIEAGLGADGVSGGAGADHISGGSTGDWLFGDDGDDTVLGDDGDDWIEGGAGRDGLRGGLGADFILGGADGDWIFGDAGDDTLVGGDGDDWIEGGRGRDGISGGAGDDYLNLSTNADANSDEGGWILGGAGNDTLIASDSSLGVAMDGGEGHDGILGGSADDTIDGGLGNDWLSGGAGVDTIRGGDGDDFIDGGTGRDNISDSGGNNHIVGGADGDFIAAEGNNIIDGGTGDDDIRTGAGVDLIDGGTGNDFIDAGGGHDTVYDGTGNDTVAGGAGNDTLFGQAGNDFLQGGAGLDTFVFAAGPGTVNADTISDYLAADDSIQLVRSTFTALALGALPATAFHAGTSAGDSSDRIIYDSATGRLWYDADGTGPIGHLLIGTINGDRAGVTASEFTVI